jgi:hypothetical protein
LDAIVERALEKNPDDRFSSALEMRDAIEAYLATTGKAPRTEDIGRQVGEMFVSVREAIKRQIQEHVEGAGKTSDSEIRSSSAVRPRDGTKVSQELPVLTTGSSSPGVSGASSSGVVSREPAPVEVVEVAAPPRSSASSASSAAASSSRTPLSPPPSSATSAPPAPSSVVPATGAVAPPSAPPRTGVSGTTLTVVAVLLLAAVVGTSVATQVLLQKAPPATPTLVTQFSDPTATTATAAPPVPVPPPPPVDHGSVAVAPPLLPSSSKGTHKGHAAPPPTAPTAPPSTPPPAPLAADGVGYVTFDTYPWTRVTEGGTSLGTTPLVHVPLSPGAHTLTLDNPEQSIHETYVITVKGGESVTKRLGLK